MKKILIVIVFTISILCFLSPIFASADTEIVQIKEMERISLNLFQSFEEELDVKGYLLINGKQSKLPIGSTLYKKKGIFYWLPGPGFLGDYELVFASTKLAKEKRIKINISPKYGEFKAYRIKKNISITSSSEPFGSFDTPSDGSTVRGSIAVTGWALDDGGIESVKIYREAGNHLIYIGEALLVEGARPDVAASYPTYPNNTKAGWGYMLLTNFLPNSGNGTFQIHAIANDTLGNSTTLGTKTIYADNANAVKPFGAIDTPSQGGTASGSSFINWGWVLTPQPNSIPIDGSTIKIYVDGVNVGNPTYNIYRSDIASLFPGYANSDGAVGYFYLDTTQFANGVHTIQWGAVDSGGNTDGIGSRYFTVSNLPPDPGEEGNATVEGIDSNNNGVRDDIERHIALNYDDEDTRNTLTECTIKLQNLILNSQDISRKTSIYNALLLYNSISDVYDSLSRIGNAADLFAEYLGKVYNTAERILAYCSSQSQLSGTYDDNANLNCNNQNRFNHLINSTQNNNVIKIFFSNGMFTSLDSAIESIRELKCFFNSEINDNETFEYAISYNNNEFFLFQFVEILRQKSFLNWESFFLYTRQPLLAPEWFRDEMTKLSTHRKATSEYVIDGDLKDHVQKYKAAINAGKKVLVVAHSQGNFYANLAYNLVDSKDFRIVSVANPDNHVGGGRPYPYVTLNQDKIINSVRGAYATTLPGNIDNSTYDFFGINHGFIDSYLNGDETGPEIKKLMRYAIGSMTGQITIRSNPSPVPYSGYNDGRYCWDLDFYIEEKAGVGATLLEWRYEMYTNEDELFAYGSQSIQNFIDWFVDSDDPTNGYIKPYGTLSCKSFYYWRTEKKGFYSIDYMKFRDDNNNEFWVTGQFTFISEDSDKAITVTSPNGGAGVSLAKVKE